MPSKPYDIHKTKQYDGSYRVRALSFPDTFINGSNPNNSIVRLMFPSIQDAKKFANEYQTKLNK
jgi:hypothetical protein